jgi:FMN phosphatase YigB (HAD superfamily)
VNGQVAAVIRVSVPFTLRRLAVDADQAVFVEDQVDYCEGAEALGIRALRIEREGRDPDLERQPVIGTCARSCS